MATYIHTVEGCIEAGLNPDDAKAKSAAAQQVLPLINDVEDTLEREHYRQMLARKLGVDERVLRQITPSANPKNRRVVGSSVAKSWSAANCKNDMWNLFSRFER